MIQVLLATARLASAVFILTAVLAAAPAGGWQAGLATIDITPENQIWLGGYAARTRPAEATAQPLRAKVLLLRDGGGGRFVFITLDAIGVTRVLRKNLEARLRDVYQLQPHEFLVNASHTHSGPEYRPARVPAEQPEFVKKAEAYATQLEQKVVDAVGRAINGAGPARLSYTRARAGFAMNRRLPQPNAEPRNAPYPDGPVDHDVPVLKVEGPDGALRGVMFGYACHNTTLTQANYSYCGDYAGYAQEYLEAEQPGVTALFITGCGGDQNPYPRGTLELAQAHGRTLATSVQAALGATARPLPAALKSAMSEIQLRFAPPPPRATFEGRLKSKDKQEALHARRMLDTLDQTGRLSEHYPYPMQVVQLGSDLTLIALSGEVVVDYSLRLKHELGGPARLWVSAYSNDVMGYIPSERILREGGYEGATAMRLGIHPGPWAPGIEEQIVGTVKELVARVRGKRGE